MERARYRNRITNWLNLFSERFKKHALPANEFNLLQCTHDHLWSDWFKSAEHSMEQQWSDHIWPLISNFDFSNVLELSPGAGRNTARLSRLSNSITAVDCNQYALDACRQRIGDSHNGCAISYKKNNGVDLSMVPSGSVTTVYCWDSAVHFESAILDSYIHEFARVLVKGGCGFLNHSILGRHGNSDIKKNPGWRSNASIDSVAKACVSANLRIVHHKHFPRHATNSDSIVFEDAALVFER